MSSHGRYNLSVWRKITPYSNQFPGQSGHVLFSVIFVLFCLFLAIPEIAFAQEEAGDDQSGNPTSSFQVGQKSTAASIFDPTNSISGSSSVNLYSGQHVESFPLLSLAGSGGIGVNISLDYNGNVTQQAKTENRLGQVSVVGLGFSLGQQSIIVDHSGTVDISDDSYKLITDAGPIGLRYLAADSFCTETGNPWRIKRLTATINSKTYCIGWRIIQENGLIYQYGDSALSFSSLNATQTILSWGDFVGNGVTDNDYPYPFRWDLKAVYDADMLNWVKITYEREEVFLNVMDLTQNPVDSTNSTYPYIRASRIASIKTSAEDSLVFEYSPRSDYQPYFGSTTLEFYETKKLDRISVKNKTGVILSKILFAYDYLNYSRTATFTKLLLRSITLVNGDSTKASPPIFFDYLTADSILGRIKSITYPSGAIKELSYTTLDDSANFTQLDKTVRFADSTDMTTGAEKYVWHSDNMYVDGKRTNPTVGYWDGYWHTTTIDTVHTGIGVSRDGWLAYHFRDSCIAIMRWMGGYWKTDIITNTEPHFVRYGTDVRFFTGKDCFVVTAGNPGEKLRRANFYVWDGKEWNGFPIIGSKDSLGNELQYTYRSVQVGDGMYLIGAQDMHNPCGPFCPDTIEVSRVFAGKFDWVLGTLDTCFLTRNNSNLVTMGNNFALSTNLVAFRTSGDELYWRRWENGAWDAGWTQESLPSHNYEFTAVMGLDNGFAYMYQYDPPFVGPPDDCSTFVGTLFQDDDPDSLVRFEKELGVGECRSYVLGRGRGLIAAAHHDSCLVWRWNGKEWAIDRFVSTVGLSHTLDFLSGGYVFGKETDASSSTVKLRSYLGDGDWATDSLSVSSTQGTISGDWFSVYHTDLDGAAKLALFNRYYYGDEPKVFPVCTLVSGVGGSYSSTTMPAKFQPNGYRSFHVDFRERSQPGGGPLKHYWSSFVYRLVDTLFKEKAVLSVVDKVTIKNGTADPVPIVQDYMYDGGLLDEYGRTPRFARVLVSTPYFSGSAPEGWTVHGFYNDVDSTGFYDTDIYEPDFPYPNLRDSTQYGNVLNGGHRLDGTEYYSGFFNDGDPDSIVSWSRKSFKLHQIPGLPAQTYRVQPTKVVSYAEGFTDTTWFKYDDSLGMQVKTIKRINGNTPAAYAIDSTLYLYQANISSIDSIIHRTNALALPYLQLSYIDTSNVLTELKRSQTMYEKKGSWHPKETYVWFNPTDSTVDSIKTFSTMSTLSESYNGRGNLINSMDATGVIASVKYNTDSLLPIATCINAKNTEWLYQDFEQLPAISTSAGWDTWRLDSATASTAVDGTAFTGAYSYKITNNATSGVTWGPARKIMAADLSDSLYYFSCWIQTNDSATVYCRGMNSSNSTVSGGDKFKRFKPANQSWTLIQDTFNLTAIKAAGGFDHIKVQLALQQNGSTRYVRFDDFRFHPLDAQVSATVYNPITSLPTASSGPLNVPTRAFYDVFLRPVQSKNWAGTKLDTVQFSEPSRDSLHSIMPYPQLGTNARDIVILFSGTLYYKLSLTTQENNKGRAYIYLNGVGKDSLKCTSSGCTLTGTGSFSVAKGDTVRLLTFREDNSSTSGIYRASAVNHGAALYDSTSPHWVRTERYKPAAGGGTEALVSKTFSDALGRTLQNRTTQYDTSGTAQTLVSGVATYDARGRAIKSYLPYYDLSSPAAVDDFSSPTQAVIEVNGYYDGNPGPPVDSVPFAENKYATDFQSRLIEAAGPSNTYKMTSDHTTIFEREIDLGEEAVHDIVIDADSIVSQSTSDRWGFYSKTINRYIRTPSDTDFIHMATYTNLYGDSTWLTVDTATVDDPEDTLASEILMRWSKVDRLGREVETWRVDYGKISMKYDKAGRLRFMQNDKRLGENKFVYFKYDALGRKIEEGLEDSASTCFNQANANNFNWPASGNSPTIHYKWYYDYYIDGSEVLRSIGNLVRVQSSDASYYRNYKYYPTLFLDSVKVKLPQDGGSTTKGIIHQYSFDGSLQRLTVHPKGFGNNTGRRVFDYTYDRTGRVLSVAEGMLPSGLYNKYATYSYFADGNIRDAILGRYTYEVLFGPTYSFILQKTDYQYNAAGMLTDINSTNPTSVDSVFTSYGTAKDHFAQKLNYFDGDNTDYYNGRVSTQTTQNTQMPSTGRLTRRYDYSYNDLGWLTAANDSAGSPNDQRYFYNALGQRKMIITGTSDTTKYTYYTNTPGSARLRWMTGMGADSIHYDTLGNLIDDESRPIYSMTYDYRNLPTQTYVAHNQVGGAHNYLDFVYDETEQRLKKVWHYQVKSLCSGGGSEDFIGEGEGEGEGGYEIESEGCPPGQQCDSCLVWREAKWYYLYDDDGTLLANFNENDSVVELFVNGPYGRIASYYQNNSEYLYYYLTDHLGSTRVVMQGFATDSVASGFTMAGFYTYHPFGAVNESWTNYNTKFKFTGKEHDDHASFKFDYFGARYYDPETGLFLTADKGAQFLSPYLYGGNNPVMMVDPDGNFAWFLPALIGAAFSAMTYAGTVQQDFDFGAMIGQAMLGAASGFTGAGVAVAAGRNIAAGALLGGLSSATFDGFNSAALGGDFRFSAMSFGTGAASGALGSLTSPKTSEPTLYAQRGDGLNHMTLDYGGIDNVDGMPIATYYERFNQSITEQVQSLNPFTMVNSTFSLVQTVLYNPSTIISPVADFGRSVAYYVTNPSQAYADATNFVSSLDASDYGYLSGEALGFALTGGFGKTRWASTAVKTQMLTSRARSLERGMAIGRRWVGKDAVAFGKYRLRSADGLRQFRFSPDDIGQRHLNFDIYSPENLYMPTKKIHMPIIF